MPRLHAHSRLYESGVWIVNDSNICANFHQCFHWYVIFGFCSMAWHSSWIVKTSLNTVSNYAAYTVCQWSGATTITKCTWLYICESWKVVFLKGRVVMKTLVNETSNSADHTTQYIFCGASFVAFDENIFGAGSFFSWLGSWDRINANIVHFYAKCFPRNAFLNLQCVPGTQI